MALSEEISQSLLEATKRRKQPEEVALRLVKWLEALAEGRSQLEDEDEAVRHMETVLDAVSVVGYENGERREGQEV